MGMPGGRDGKVTVFDFSEIMERTEKRVGDEILGPGPQNVDELRAIARRVKSKYLMRIQLKEKHLSPAAANNPPAVPLLSEKIPQMPSKESVKNVTNSVIGGMGGFVSMLSKKQPQQTSSLEGGQQQQQQTTLENKDPNNKTEEEELSSIGGEVEVGLDGTTLSGGGPGDTPSNMPATPKSPANPFAISSPTPPAAATAADTTTSTATATTNDDENKNDTSTNDELEKLTAELGDLSAMTEAFDLLGDDFNLGDVDVDEHAEELLDAMDEKVDPFAAFGIDDEDFLS